MSKRRELKEGDLVRITGRSYGHVFAIGSIGSVQDPHNAYGNVQVIVGTLTQGVDRSSISYDRKANADKAKYEARRG